MTDVVLLVARLLLGVPFIVWGVMKLRGGDASLVPVLAKMGMPDAKFLAFMVGLCEFVGGVGVVLGYPARTVGVLLALWCLTTALVMQRKHLESLLSHLTMAGGFVMLAAVGAGTWSLFGGAPSGIFAYLP